jgi:uncharacterized membrane protein
MATVTHAGEPASLMAIDKRGLTGYAERQNVLLELVPAVGQHVGRGAPVLVVHGASPVDENLLRKALIFGEERTIDGDPSFGFRLLVDVAVKALSPAINDPTTVVQVLDRLEDLLRFAGQRRLSDGVERDANDVPRLAFRTPSWNDFLELSLSEIIVYGAAAPQVTRRVAGLLANLESDLPSERRPMLAEYRDHLVRATTAAVSDPVTEHLHCRPTPRESARADSRFHAHRVIPPADQDTRLSKTEPRPMEGP